MKRPTDAECLLSMIDEREMLNIGGTGARNCVKLLIKLLTQDGAWTKDKLTEADKNKLRNLTL